MNDGDFVDTSNRALNVVIHSGNNEGVRRETFADETSTGRLGRARRSRRGIVAAAVEGHDYDCWLAFCRDYFVIRVSSRLRR